MEWAVIVVPAAALGTLVLGWIGFWGVAASSVVGWYGDAKQAAPLVAITGGAGVLGALGFAYVALVTGLAWGYVLAGRRALRQATWVTWSVLGALVALAVIAASPFVGYRILAIVLLPALHLFAARAVTAFHDARDPIAP